MIHFVPVDTHTNISYSDYKHISFGKKNDDTNCQYKINHHPERIYPERCQRSRRTLIMNNLIPIDEIIKITKEAGATFGHGDPKTHLAYLTKLRLLPQAVRRKVNNKVTGCYPSFVIDTLLEIERLKDQGLTHSQIKHQLAHNNQVLTLDNQAAESEINTQGWKGFLPAYRYSTISSGVSGNSVAFLVIGLLLGFLVATINNMNNMKSATIAAVEKGNQPVMMVATNPASIPDSYSQNLINLVTRPQTQGANTVYVIALPQQNLNKLGQMNINNLNKN